MKFVCLSLLLAFLVSCKPAPEQPDKSPKILPDAISAILDKKRGASWRPRPVAKDEIDDL